MDLRSVCTIFDHRHFNHNIRPFMIQPFNIFGFEFNTTFSKFGLLLFDLILRQHFEFWPFIILAYFRYIVSFGFFSILNFQPIFSLAFGAFDLLFSELLGFWHSVTIIIFYLFYRIECANFAIVLTFLNVLFFTENYFAY